MSKVTRFLGASAVMLLAVYSTGQAQGSAAIGGFGPGYTDIGPVIGLGGIGDASISIGGRFEHGIKTLPSLSNGVLGIEISADWYHYNWCKPGDCSLTYIPVGATANYHFHLEDKKFDPFIGLGLGFEIVNCSNAFGFDCGAYSSAVYFIGRLGARYFMNPNLALYGDLGAGAATLNVGVMFKMKGAR